MSERADERIARIEDAVSSHSPALLAFLARRVQPSHHAADLLAETLLILWKRSAALPSRDEEVKPWMFGIARNVLLHHLRTTSRQRAVADRLRSELSAINRPGYVDSPDFDELHRALGKLNQVDRDIIGLVHWEGFSLVEVSRILRMKQGTVRSRYHRARSDLRADLAEASSETEAPQTKPEPSSLPSGVVTR